LKDYYIEYKPFLIFLAKFFGTYLLLTLVYQTYLGTYDVKKFEVDGVTQLVAQNTKQLLTLVDSQSYTKPNLTEPCVNLYYHDTWVARIIEGCNALSVMILFVSFIVAFSGKFKTTLIYIITGVILIYFFNVLRIALLCMAVFHFKQYKEVLHDVIFPLFIYGIVFILWIIWVNKFSEYAKNKV